MTVRKYSSRSQQTTLSAPITSTAATMTVVNGAVVMGGKTLTGAQTYTVVIDPDTALEEIVDVTVYSSGNTLNITRGIDGPTPGTGVAHSAGAIVRHMAIGRDYQDANDHIEKTIGTVHGVVLADIVKTTDTATVSTAMLATNAVTTAKITDLNVTTAKIADSAITSAKIADLTIATGDIADSAITSAKIANLTIATGDIADSAITSAKIADLTIVAGDIADGAITSAKILDGTIVNADINSAAAIAYSKLNLTGSITSSDITDGTIVNADVNTSAQIAYGKLNLTNTIVNADINASAAIALSKLATDPLARANHTGTQTASTISNFDTQVRTSRLDQMAAPTASVSANSQKVTNLATPTVSTDAATKAYADLMIPLTQKGAASGVAELDADGLLPANRLPALSITTTQVVASQAAMLALTAQTGDVAVRTDLNKTFILAASPATTLGNWQELLTPTDAVLSVDGQTGTVSLSSTYATIAQNNAKLSLTGGTMSGAIEMGTNKITGLGTPTVSTDAATKAYADSIVATAPSNLTGPITSVGNVTSVASQTGTGSTFVMNTTPTIGTLYSNSITNTSTSVAATLYPSITTGSVSVGQALTTGSVSIANNAVHNGTVNISSGAGTVNKTVNIGTSSTAGTTTINIGTTAGATSNVTINGTAIPASKTLVATDSTTFVVPSQTGNSGKYLTTNGTVSSWGTIPTNYVSTDGGSSITVASGTSVPLTITNVGTGNSFVVEDSANPDSSPFIIDTNGFVISGFTSPPQILNPANNIAAYARLNIIGTSSGDLHDSRIIYGSANTTVAAPYSIYARSNTTTLGAQAAVASGDLMGGQSWQASDGTAIEEAARISGFVDGTVSTGVVPGRLSFYTASSAGTTTERMRIDSSGAITVGTGSAPTISLRINRQMTGGVTTYGMSNQGTVQSDVTTSAVGYYTGIGTAATAFTLGSIIHYQAVQGTIGAGSTVTNQYGFFVPPGNTGATNNYGFFSQLGAASSTWNFYASGTAANYFAGQTTVGSTSLTLGTTNTVAQQFGVVSGAATTVAAVIRGAASQSAQLTQWQNSAGTAVASIGSAGDMLIASNATGGSSLEIGSGRTVDGNTLIDLIGDTTYTDYGLRIIRNSGATGGSSIISRGTGGLTISTQDVGAIAFQTQLTNRLLIDTVGKVAIGASLPNVSDILSVTLGMTGSVSAQGINVATTIASDVTTNARGFNTFLSTAAAAFTLGNLVHYRANQNSIGAGSTVSAQVGFIVEASLVGANTNYGFVSNIPAATGRWNFWGAGTAPNYFAGQTTINSTSLTLGTVNTVAQAFGVVSGAATTVTAVIRGAASQSASLMQLQNSAGVSVVDMGPTGNISMANATTATAALEIGSGRTVDGNTYIDMIGDTTYTDYGLRIIRGSGANGVSYLQHRGTGSLALVAQEAGSILLQTTNITRMHVNATGEVGIGTTPLNWVKILTAGLISSSSSESRGIQSGPTFPSTATLAMRNFYSVPGTEAATFTAASIRHFEAGNVSIGAGSTVTEQVGFRTGNMTGATNNHGFQGNVATATGAYNFYAAGTAPNYFAGRTGVGILLTSSAQFGVTNTQSASDVTVLTRNFAAQTADSWAIQNSAGSSVFAVTAAGYMKYISGNTATTVGAAGGASALPATPTGYLKIDIGGTEYKVPYYAA